MVTPTPTATAGTPRTALRRRAAVRWRASSLQGLVPLAALLVAWQVFGSADSVLYPVPSTWVEALADLWGRGRLGVAVAATLQTFALGFAVATVAGAALGILVGRSRAADRALNPTFEFARALPPAVLVPVASLLLGFDETMKVTVVTLAAIWPVLLNTRTGVTQIEGTLLDTARTLRLGRLQRLRKIVVPALFPSILLGMRVAAPIALVITLLVEILTHVGGVGALIADAQRTFQPARAYGLIAVAGAISFGVHTIVSALESYAYRYRPR